MENLVVAVPGGVTPSGVIIKQDRAGFTVWSECCDASTDYGEVPVCRRCGKSIAVCKLSTNHYPYLIVKDVFLQQREIVDWIKYWCGYGLNDAVRLDINYRDGWKD